ncbi:MAG: [FeFe] hydrogenase H-cluster maturation GTPase HydF [Bacteroidales bacterium]|nr:[FeFe] hydrogenase H-cluster maturation GTPase HydF [Bacteroidales bacterium]
MAGKGRDRSPHIGIYGRRNYGKSSLINAIAGQDIAIVSDTPGTTTDPVKKSFEITGFGPVILIDTAGIDDTGELGTKRVHKTVHSIDTVDMAILLTDGNEWGGFEEDIVKRFNDQDIPYLVLAGKSDLRVSDESFALKVKASTGKSVMRFSVSDKEAHEMLIGLIRETIPSRSMKLSTLLGDLIGHGDIVLLITPIDVEAPEGRLILPQVQVIRDILDNDAVAITLKEREVDAFLKRTGIVPALAVTDSQVFVKADASIPREVPLTSFSILLARQKGDFENYLAGTPAISDLKDGDRVLLLESCTHHVACDDIGRVKIPRWISNFTGRKIEFEVVAGLDSLPRPVTEYALVIQCGGCMITARQLQQRLRAAVKAGIPVTNYGMAIAYVQGIFDRAVAPFRHSAGNSHQYL